MLPSHDIELLSAYLDEQLNTSDRLQLERRIRQEPSLQLELEALRRTRLMLRSMPRRRAPRNFTLTPEMAGLRPTFTRRPAFGVISALAVVLLIFILVGDVLVIPEYIGMFPVSQARSSESAASAPESLMMEKEEALIFPTEQPAPTPVPTPTPTPSPELMLAQPAAESMPEATPEAAIMADALPTPAADTLESARAFSEEAPLTGVGSAAAPDITSTMPLAQTPVLTETLTVQIAPVEATEVAVELKQSPADSAGVYPQNRRSVLWAQVVFWMAELLLLSIAVGAGLVGLYFWFRRRNWTRRM